MKITDDNYIVRAKEGGVPDKIIAGRMGITVEELNRRWSAILRDVEAKMENGYLALSQQFHTMAGQYQLLGESLKIMADALGAVMTDDELHRLITSDPAQTFQNLKKAAIILRPFVEVNPQESIQQTLRGN